MGDELNQIDLLLDALILQIVVNDARQLYDAHNRHDDDRQQRHIEDGSEIDAHHRGDAQPADVPGGSLRMGEAKEWVPNGIRRL